MVFTELYPLKADLRGFSTTLLACSVHKGIIHSKGQKTSGLSKFKTNPKSNKLRKAEAALQEYTSTLVGLLLCL